MLYGIDIGGSKIEIAVFDQSLSSLWTKRIATPQNHYQDFLNSIIQLIKEADDFCQEQGSIGIGIPGIINQQNQLIYTTNINVAKNKPLVHDLEHHLARKIHIENDANCFVLSEFFSDENQSNNNMLGIILGTGFGGGLIINQRIVSGNNGCAGEIGHMSLPFSVMNTLSKPLPLIPCGCGKIGCGERYLSGTGFEWLYQHYYHTTLSAPAIITHYYQQDPKAQAHVERYLELLAAYLANVLMIVDSQIIVIGGGLSHFDEIYQQLPEKMAKYLLKQMNVPLIKKAKYGDSGGSRGAALLATCNNIK